MPAERRHSRFWPWLLAIVAVALGVRVAYVTAAMSGPCEIRVDGEVVDSYPSDCLVGDQLYYNAAANLLARGDGFVEPFPAVERPGEEAPPAADHPPLTVLVLAPVSWLAERPPLEWIAGDDAHAREHRYAMALLGAGLVVLVGLLGRRVGGDATGLVAAAVAALSPNIWLNDAVVMSETVAGLTVVGALLLALTASERPTPVTVAGLGACCGLAALARAELLLFVPLLVVPVLWPHRPRARHLVLGLGASVLVIAPWVAYNLSRFEERTFISTNDGLALAASNCDAVYEGKGIGLTSYEVVARCVDDPQPPGDQSEVARVYRNRALRYMRQHVERVPLVVAARIGRTWSVYRPLDMVDFNVGEGRERWVTRLGLAVYYPTLIGAVAGAALLWQRRARRVLWVLLVPVVTVTVGAAVTYGQTRFRAAAEPSLAVLAAVAVVALVQRLRTPQGDGTVSSAAPSVAGSSS